MLSVQLTDQNGARLYEFSAQCTGTTTAGTTGATFTFHAIISALRVADAGVVAALSAMNIATPATASPVGTNVRQTLKKGGAQKKQIAQQSPRVSNTGAPPASGVDDIVVEEEERMGGTNQKAAEEILEAEKIKDDGQLDYEEEIEQQASQVSAIAAKSSRSEA